MCDQSKNKPCLDWNENPQREEWCQRIPDNHNEDVCHNISVKRRDIICEMKKLVNACVDQPVCEQWDTECTTNNTKGPYRFGKIEPSKQHQELIGGQLISRCDCGKRNGLQDDCRRWNCRGSPECKITPFPKCGPFRGEPSDRTLPAYNPQKECYMPTFMGPDRCEKCDCRTMDLSSNWSKVNNQKLMWLRFCEFDQYCLDFTTKRSAIMLYRLILATGLLR